MIIAETQIPGLFWLSPFTVLLLCIAVLPLIPSAAGWWHHNSSKLTVALTLGLVTIVYYYFRGYGFHHASPGLPTVKTVLSHAVIFEFIPFMSLLFALYVISGGIVIKGDIPAHPLTNVCFLAIGGGLASFIGTTGASMLMIRPLLSTNSERKHVAHTVVFFIFIVSNIGGSLLPIGDPPLLLGFLRGVPFFWTLKLWKETAFCIGALLAIYYVWDHLAYRTETKRDIQRDETRIRKITVNGQINFFWLLCVLVVTATLGPIKPFPGTEWLPPRWLREILQFLFVGLSLYTTPRSIRKANNFNYSAIAEVACLFIGIFICMQVPLELLNARGEELGVRTPVQFFWMTGLLSSFLDNAPTYLVFFETANAMTHAPGPGIIQLVSGHFMREDLLVAISLGAVFMGANTYIGNGPNFMVKSIAEHAGIRMPGFFGYMAYSVAILVPLFVLVSFLFL